MRFTIALEALCGVAAVSALTVPSMSRRADGVDLSPYEAGRFTLLSPEQAKADAINAGEYDPERAAINDGPRQSSKIQTAGFETDSLAASAAEGACPGGVSTRHDWRNLYDFDKDRFTNAVKCLMGKPSGGSQFPNSQSRYEDLVSVHQQKTSDIHMVGQFLPWHRYFLNIFETMLREECGFDGPMPWWDETLDAGNFGNSPVFTSGHFGHLPMRTADGQGSCVGDGAYAGMTLHLGPGGGFSDHCLARAGDESLTAQCNADFVNTCNSRENYADMESCAEMGPHAYAHNGIGAVMSDVSPSPGDPVFFLHHGFVDRNWRIWQNIDLNGRLYQIGGQSSATDPNQRLTLDYVLSSNGLRPDRTVREVMDTEGGYLCYRYDH